jgi:hypothetical protein
VDRPPGAAALKRRVVNELEAVATIGVPPTGRSPRHRGGSTNGVRVVWGAVLAHRWRAIALAGSIVVGTWAYAVLRSGAAQTARAAGHSGAPATAAGPVVATLGALLLVVCALPIVNATTAGTRDGRAELRQLARLGVPRAAMVGHQLGEICLAMLLATAGALVLDRALDVTAAGPGPRFRPATQLVLTVVAAAAVAASTWRTEAARRSAAPHPRIIAVRAGRRPPRTLSMIRVAMAHVRHAPGRTACVVVASTAASAALSLVAASRAPTRVDWTAAAAIVVLCGFVAADTGWLNGVDRRAEVLDMLRLGASRSHLAGLAAWEAVIVGVTGSAAGAAMGLLIVAAAGDASATASLPVIGAVVTTAIACLVVLARLAITASAWRGTRFVSSDVHG